jgi:hypothetical protein
MKAKLLLFVACAAAILTASAQTPAGKTAPTKTDLRKLLEDTEWVSPKRRGGQGERTFVFRRNGEMTDSHPGGGKYRHYFACLKSAGAASGYFFPIALV